MSFQPFGWEDEFTFLFSEGMGNMLVSRLAYLPWNMGLKHLPTLLVHLQGMAYEPCPVPSSAPYCCVPRCFREVTFMIAVWILLKWSTLMSHEFGMEILEILLWDRTRSSFHCVSQIVLRNSPHCRVCSVGVLQLYLCPQIYNYFPIHTGSA